MHKILGKAERRVRIPDSVLKDNKINSVASVLSIMMSQNQSNSEKNGKDFLDLNRMVASA